MASPRSVLAGSLVALAAVVFWAIPLAAQTADEPVTDQTLRARWTSSRIVGSPDPPPGFKTVVAFPNLKFQRPLVFARAPGTDRLFVGEQSGVLYSFPNRADAKAEPFFDLPKQLQTLHLHSDAKEVEAVYGLVFHPDFERNRFCYVCYTLRPKDPKVRNLENGTRVSRFRVTESDPPQIDPASEEIVITFLQGGHNGGDLHFGPDGMLYISTGDAANPNPPDPFNTGQDISDLLSSILRIDVDRRDAGQNYAVPADNPFRDLAGARPEVWAYGFRNPWRMSFDRESGQLLVGDVGWELWEMVYRVERGGNYGWAATEGPQPIKVDQVGPTPIHPAAIELPHTIACSVTGGYVYRGKKFPELRGAYVFGDWETRRLWAARFDDGKLSEMPELARASIRVSTFGEDHDGELYLLDYDDGRVYTLERNDAAQANADFPTSLSDSGLFRSVRDHTLAEGVRPFTINSRQWLDGATSDHFIAVPGDSSVVYHAKGKPIPGLVYWHNFRMHFPKNAVLGRTISHDSLRIETQILHYDGEDWRGYTYAWRDDQSDADLVPAEGDEKELTLGDRKQAWQFHSRTQCMSCHSNQTEYALAFLPEQLNRPLEGGKNQLVSLTEEGFLRRAGDKGEVLPPFDQSSVDQVKRITDPSDSSQPLEARARGYLHSNCGHCHSDGGGGAVPLRLQYSVSAEGMNAIDVRPTRGDFGLPEAALVKPGAPHRSTLYFRMAKFGRDRMPHIGSERPDEAGLQLIEDWIEAMSADSASTEASPSVAESKPLDQDPAEALRLARKLGRDQLSAAERTALVAAVEQLSPGPTRDLFEGYLPGDGQRKLGSSPRPQAILALLGDPEKGSQLYWSESLSCSKCHRIDDRGSAVGPDLTAIGSQRSREHLLESLLSPSLRVEPKYASYGVLTVEGQTLTGLLVRRDEREVVLRDNQGKEVTLAADQVEQLRPLRNSLMPDGQLAGLTAQDAADLLAFLTSRRERAAGDERQSPPASAGD
jgi:putative heme-binding domain-containing protein